MERSSRAEHPKTRPTWETLEAWVRGKVQEFVQELLEVEVTELLGRQRHERRAGVDAPIGYRNGYGKPRRLAVQTGTIVLQRPRVRGLEAHFESRVLPLFARRTEQVADLLPELYLHGLAQGDFELALRGLLGDGAPLSAKSIERLRAKFVVEYETWKTRSLAEHELVYAWADGIYVRAGLEREKAALLVVIGALRDGRKEVLAVVPGYRESTDSWRTVLRDLRDRGLQVPKLLVADGAAGIWAAVTELWPGAAEQRCWNHKIVNVLTQLPKTVHAAAREELAAMPYAATRAEAERRRDAFAKQYRRAYPRAVAILETDWERLVTFYGFPEGHWKHLRTTNVIESPFAAVRLRTDAAKRFKKVENATALLWRLLVVAERRFRRLDAPEQLAAVYDGRKFEDGKLVKEKAPKVAA
jgi:putative transposase